MQITAVFNSIEEVLEFSDQMSGNLVDIKTQVALSTQTPAPAASAVADTTTAYGQQIAEHFPAANNSQVQQTAPATQQTPTVPQQTAPATQQSMPPVQQQPVQTTAPTYQLEDLSRAAMQLMDKGMQEQLQQLLAGYGVESLPSLPAEQYGNFATALRGMGAQI